jgi:hypothetical protein
VDVEQPHISAAINLNDNHLADALALTVTPPTHQSAKYCRFLSKFVGMTSKRALSRNQPAKT